MGGLVTRGENESVAALWAAAQGDPAQQRELADGLLLALLQPGASRNVDITKWSSLLGEMGVDGTFLGRTGSNPPVFAAMLKLDTEMRLPANLRGEMLACWLRFNPAECLAWSKTQAGSASATEWLKNSMDLGAWNSLMSYAPAAYAFATAGGDAVALGKEQAERMWSSLFRGSGLHAASTPGLMGAREINAVRAACESREAEALQQAAADLPAGALGGFAAALAREDPAAATFFLAHQKLDGSAASQFAEDLSGQVTGQQAMSQLVPVMEGLAEQDREKLASGVLHRIVAKMTPEEFASQDVQVMLSGLPESAQGALLGRAVSSYALYDRVAASAWLAEMPDGPGKRAGAEALLPHIVDDAEAWAAWKKITSQPAAP